MNEKIVELTENLNEKNSKIDELKNLNIKISQSFVETKKILELEISSKSEFEAKIAVIESEKNKINLRLADFSEKNTKLEAELSKTQENYEKTKQELDNL
jgi:hypothetical protein